MKAIFHFFIAHVIRPFRHYIRNHIKKPFKGYVQNHIQRPFHVYLENHSTFEFEVKLKSRLKPSYKKTHIAVTKKVYNWVQNIEKEKKRGKKMTVIFLCQYIASWNAYMSTFQAALADPDVEVYLLALPEKILKKGANKKKSYITHEEYGENMAYPFCTSFYPDAINAYNPETHRWFNIGVLQPDYVFIQRPYQMYLPPQYRCTVLATYTKICYLPYSYCKQLWDSRSVYRHNFINYVYMVFSENQLYCDMLRKIYCDIFQASWKKIEFFGYPRFDMYKNVTSDISKTEKTVLWLPRWTTEDDIEATTFFKYKDILIDYFKSHPEMRLICRPHPKTFGHFIAIGAMTGEEVAQFKRLFAETENFLLDESGDYLPAFANADVFISDTSSLLVEEFATGKPIIFCGAMWRFDEAAQQWASMMYPVTNQQELMVRMADLLAGNDPNRELRQSFIQEKMKHDGKSGERILQFLKEDYKNTMPAEETKTIQAAYTSAQEENHETIR